MTIFKSEFVVGNDENGTRGLIPEFMPGVFEYYLTAQSDPQSVAHDIIEHGRDNNEGDATSELAAVGAYAVGRWGFTARSGNQASAISGDVCNILTMDTIRGEALAHEGPIEEWVKAGVREGLRMFIDEIDARGDEDQMDLAVDTIRSRRQIESAIQNGAERCVNVYGSSDLAFEAFSNAAAAANDALYDIGEMPDGTTITFTTDTDTRETTFEVMATCLYCGNGVEQGEECCE